MHTRDIGNIDPEGYLLVTDRVKDVLWAEQGVISKCAVPEVLFVDKLEKTSVGKLDKKLMRQAHG